MHYRFKLPLILEERMEKSNKDNQAKVIGILKKMGY